MISLVESSFLIWFKLLNSTSQLNSTLFQKKIQLNLILFKSSTRLELKYLTRLNQFDQQQDLSVQNADYESSASYACQKSWIISSTEQ